MTVQITPTALCGEIQAIASKSDVHRLLICAALADKRTDILLSGSMDANNLSEDIKATVNCLVALGATVSVHDSEDKTVISVIPITKIPNNPILNCGESGSTLRFILPVAAALLKDGNTVAVTGKGRLPNRPIKELADTLKKGGITFSSDSIPFTISGRFLPGTYEIPGNISSQYITGLLFGLAAANSFFPNRRKSEASGVKLTSELQSSAYIDITLNAMQKFGLKTLKKENSGLYTFELDSDKNRFISPGTVTADGDWSNAAFFIALKNLGHKVSVSNLTSNSPQGDKAIINVLKHLSENLVKREISLAEIPDLLPILAVVAAFSEGETHFTNGERLRIKESDRLASVAELINSLGGKAEEQPTGLTVFPKPLTGGKINSCNDHRIVMAAATAAASCSEPVIIYGAEAVNKSYPTFFKDYELLGGIINVI